MGKHVFLKVLWKPPLKWICELLLLGSWMLFFWDTSDARCVNVGSNLAPKSPHGPTNKATFLGAQIFMGNPFFLLRYLLKTKISPENQWLEDEVRVHFFWEGVNIPTLQQWGDQEFWATLSHHTTEIAISSFCPSISNLYIITCSTQKWDQQNDVILYFDPSSIRE